jgi:hypothetical protein
MDKTLSHLFMCMVCKNTLSQVKVQIEVLLFPVCQVQVKVQMDCVFLQLLVGHFFQLFLVLRGVRILQGYNDPSNKNKIKNILTYFFTSQKYEYIIHYFGGVK